MANILALRLEALFDRRFVRAIRDAITRDPELASAFDPRTTVVYRVPPPDAVEVEIGAKEPDRSFRFRRSLLEMIGLGHRMYLVDAKPMCQFAKPVALFVFEHLGATPVRTVRSDWPLFVNRATFPFFDPDLTRRWAVAGPPADATGRVLDGPPPPPGPADLATPDAPPLLASELPPLAGPFPPEPPQLPADGKTPPKLSAPADDPCAGQGERLFFGLCFQHASLVHNPDGTTKLDDGFWDKTKEVADAFRARGYATETAQAGRGGMNTAADMIAWLGRGLSAHPEFCKSDCDQLVIFIMAHGSETSLQFDGKGYYPQTPDTDLSHGALMDLLGALPALKGKGKKIYLILSSCHSGTVWTSPVFPPSLRGLHLVTSTPGAGEATSVYQNTLLIKALLEKTVHSWQDLLAWFRWLNQSDAWGPNAADHPPWANGDIDGCAASIKLIGMKYGGADLGIFAFSVGAPQGASYVKGLSHDGDDTPNVELFPLRIVGPCGEHMRVRININAYQSATATSAKKSFDIDGTCDKLCNGTDGDFILTSDFPPASVAAASRGTLELKFFLRTEC